MPPNESAPSAEPDRLAAFMTAIHAGNTQTVAQLLAAQPALANARAADGQYPLHAAAQCNDPQLGALLLSHGADPQAKFGDSGHTVLSWAVTCHAMEFARALVHLGVAPDLFVAAGIGSLKHVHGYFDESGALKPGAAQSGSTRFAPDGARLTCPPATASEQISDALYIACRTGQADVVRFLLTKNPDLAFRAYEGATPLHWAHFGGSREVIGLLEQAGADCKARDDTFHCTPRAFGICVPCRWGFPHLVKARLAEDPTLAVCFDGQTSPLHEAARGGNLEVVRMLLDAGADPARPDAQGRSALDVATEVGHAWVIEMLRGVAGS